MIINKCLIFEENLIKEYEKNPNPELAEVLIKEFSSHFIKSTQPSAQLEKWIIKRSMKALKNLTDTEFIFGLRGHGQRPNKEPLYICMNAFCWDLIFKEITITSAYEQVADIFETSSDFARIGFERKNHDFGERELCRFGLDLFIAINQKNITNNQANLVKSILNETIDVQMIKDLNHHRAKYKSMLQRL
tara:strand:+ start:57 stop:626 length:570 start_codon:yes stop_codon:yes gene_type:complete